METHSGSLESTLGKLTKIVDSTIKEVLTSFVDQKFQRLVKHHLTSGGKRLRPALAIICCRLLSGKTKDVLWAASGLEILHNYTLIVDDIIDNSSLRRGKPTVWKKFGKSIAQCVSMCYAPAIFQAAVKSKNPVKITELFAKTLKIVVEGEILDILFEQSGRTDEPYIMKNRYKNIKEPDYFNMAGKKTASLFETCCEVGGVAAGAQRKQLDALRNYGYNLGLAFQITDDILDIFGKEKEFGKVVGGDIAERKLGNIVMLYSFEELEPGDKRRFLKIMRKKKISKKDIKEAVKLIKITNSRQKAEALAKKFVEKAKNSLNNLPQNKWNELLSEVSDFIVLRST